RFLLGLQNATALGRVDDGAELGSLVRLVADLESLEESALRVDEVVRDFPVNVNPVNRAARLAVMLVRVPTNQARDHLRIGIFQDDGGAVASHLPLHTGPVPVTEAHDLLSDSR